MDREVQWVEDRAVRWQVPFVSLDGKHYRVDIYDDGYIWEPEVLKGGATPFYTQEDDDDDAFLPIRTSSGYLTIVVEDPSLPDAIMAQDTHDRYVELVDATDANNEVVKWNGFLSPEEYSGEWNCTPFELSLPLLSPVAAAAKIVYEPLSRECTVADIIKHIFDDYLDISTSFAFARIINGEVSSIRTTDHLFESQVEAESQPYVGTIPLPALDSEKSNVYDVLEAICRLCGWVLHETPTRYFFTASDVTSTYSYTSDFVNYETVSLPVVNLPAITSADHQRYLLSGKSAVQVVCEAEHYEELAEANLIGNVAEDFHPLSASEPFAFSFRHGKDTNHSIAFNPSTGITEIDLIDVWWHNANYNSQPNWQQLYGGGWYTYKEQVHIGTEFHQFMDPEDCVFLSSVDTNDLYPAASFVTEKKYTANNFLENGLILKFDAVCAGEYVSEDFKYCYRDVIYIRVKWGDYYFQGYDPSNMGNFDWWGTSPQLVPVMIENIDSTSGEAIGHAFSCSREKNPSSNKYDWGFINGIFLFNHAKEGYWMPVYGMGYANIEGNIEVTFYCFKRKSNCRAMLIKNLKLEAGVCFDNDIATDKDYYLSDYRQILSKPRLEEYSYKQILTNSMLSRSISGATETQALAYDTPENLLLHRLARWYDRTIEQLIITTEDDLPDGSVVRIGNTEYLPVCIAHNWRDNEITLNLQKMV